MEDDFLEIIRKTFEYYGLKDQGFVNEVAKLLETKKINTDMSIDQIGVVMADTAAFQKRFPANKILKDKGQAQFSVSEYLRLEGDLTRELRSRNMPQQKTSSNSSPTKYHHKNWEQELTSATRLFAMPARK